MVVDLFLVYQFIRRLATPFNKWEAYKLGVIDENGNVLIKSKDFTNSRQRKAWGIFDRMIANLKKLLAKVPGGSSRFASYAAALFLIREYKAFTDETMLNENITDEQLDESLLLFCSRYNYYTTLSESVNQLNERADVFLEKLKASDDMGDWVKDFQDSDAPQFKGKSKDKRREMAIAAKLSAQEESATNLRNLKLIDKIKKSGVVKSGSMSKNVNTKPELEEASTPIKWKKAGPDGEIEATVKGQRFKIQKALDHNLRHKGEYKVYIWDKRSDDWEWDDTLYGKTNAKARVFFHLKENKVNTKPELEEEPANNVGSGNIAGMDGGHMSKAGQRKWTSSNKSNKKKKLRDIIGDKT